ncbi:hypothetical protein [Geodermatophilus sp. URMC 64]
MSEPQTPAGAPDAYPSGWPQPTDYDVVPPAYSTPSWQTSSWAPPAGAPVVPAPPAGNRRGVVLGLVGTGGALAGAIGAAFLVSAVFLSSAEDIGREIAQGVGEEIGTSIGEGLTRSLEESMGGLLSGDYGWSAYPPGEVEQSDPLPPAPGPDPVLNQYAQGCFDGDLQSCDDLFYESPPLSDYESYAQTCGGRVKEYTVPFCTDLGD